MTVSAMQLCLALQVMLQALGAIRALELRGVGGLTRTLIACALMVMGVRRATAMASLWLHPADLGPLDFADKVLLPLTVSALLGLGLHRLSRELIRWQHSST